MMMKAGNVSSVRAVPAAAHLKNPEAPANTAAVITSSKNAKPVGHVNDYAKREVVARATDDAGTAFGDREKEDDSAKTLKWLNTAMYRWCAHETTDLPPSVFVIPVFIFSCLRSSSKFTKRRCLGRAHLDTQPTCTLWHACILPNS